MPPTYLYSELLLNIRQVTVFALLSSPINQSTHIGISADSKTLSLEHDGVQTIMELPCPVLDIANRREDTSQELSFRLQPNGATKFPAQSKSDTHTAIPWPASRLAANTQVACRSCKKILLTPIGSWKDLPSGGWAEMMELWHCHKPDVENAEVSSASSMKGYAAGNIIGPKPGAALVDVGHLVVSDEDCVGMQPTDSLERLLECSGCGQPIGTEDKGAIGSIRLFKWSLALQTSKKATSRWSAVLSRSKNACWETFSIQKIVCAQLLSMIEDLSIYKFLVYSGEIEDAQDILLLWAFTPDLIYSTSTESAPKRAMKIFYKTITNPLATLDAAGPKMEELQLPAYVKDQLLAGLRMSTSSLPPSAKKHQEWMIGLLDR